MAILTGLEALEAISQSSLPKAAARRTWLQGGRLAHFDTQAVCQKVDTGAMSATFIITTGNGPNRNGNRVQITSGRKGDGLRLDNFQKNPVNFFDHGLNPAFPLPIGTALSPDGELAVKLTKNKALGTVFFSQKSKDAEQIFALVDEGIIRAASIMFMPVKVERLSIQQEEDEEPEMFGFDFVESDLWEFGPVGIGADPDAVRAHIDGGSLTESVRLAMEPYAAEKVAQGVGAEFTEEAAEEEPEEQAAPEVLTELQKQVSELQATVEELRTDDATETQISELRDEISDLWQAVHEGTAPDETQAVADEVGKRLSELFDPMEGQVSALKERMGIL